MNSARGLSIALLTFAALLPSCTTSPRITSPVDLKTAYMTVPDEALAGADKASRAKYLKYSHQLLGKLKNRRFHYYGDNPYERLDADAMIFLRVFEDEEGRSIVASHASRPRNAGNEPSPDNTVVFRLDRGKWRDISDEALPQGQVPSWHFDFSDESDDVPCGPYFIGGHGSTGKTWYNFSRDPVYKLRWQDGRFVLLPRIPVPS